MPFLEVIALRRRPALETFGRQSAYCLDHFAQPPFFGSRSTKEIGKPTAGFALGFGYPIPKARQRGGVIARAYQGIQTCLVRDHLAFFSVTGLESLRLPPHTLNELIVLIVNVRPIRDAGRSQYFAHPASHINRSLVSDQMAQLMRDDAGKFIFVLSRRHQFA